MKKEDIKIDKEVVYWRIIHGNGDRELPFITKIKSETWELGSGDIVCKVEGIIGGVHINHLESLEESKIKIEVSGKTFKDLMGISRKLNSQDNRATAMPYFFQVMTKKRVLAVENSGDEILVKDGEELETEEDITEAVLGYFQEEIVAGMDYDEKCDFLVDKKGWQKFWIEYIEEYQNAFLTEKACKRHIELNKYHYNKPVDYLTHAFRNPELELVIKFLCELSGGQIHK